MGIRGGGGEERDGSPRSDMLHRPPMSSLKSKACVALHILAANETLKHWRQGDDAPPTTQNVSVHARSFSVSSLSYLRPS